MRVVDLFAGLGGFSAGALEAGADVVLGVDSDPVPLKLWCANVPGGVARLAPSLRLSACLARLLENSDRVRQTLSVGARTLGYRLELRPFPSVDKAATECVALPPQRG